MNLQGAVTGLVSRARGAAQNVANAVRGVVQRVRGGGNAGGGGRSGKS